MTKRKSTKLFRVFDASNRKYKEDIISNYVIPNDTSIRDTLLFITDYADKHYNLALIDNQTILSNILNLGKYFYARFIIKLREKNRIGYSNECERYYFDLLGYDFFKIMIIENDWKLNIVEKKVKDWCLANGYPFEYVNDNSAFNIYDFACISIRFYVIYCLHKAICLKDPFLQNKEINYNVRIGNMLIFLNDYIFPMEIKKGKYKLHIETLTSHQVLSYIYLLFKDIQKKYKLSSTSLISTYNKDKAAKYDMLKCHASLLSISYEKLMTLVFNNGHDLACCSRCNNYYSGHGNSNLCPACRTYRDNHKHSKKIIDNL